MAAPATIPYPPSPDPADLPEGLTDYPPSYKAQQNLLLAGLWVFLLFYLGLVLLTALVGVYCVVTVGHLPAVKFVGMALSGLFFLFLVKGFFKRHPEDKTLHVEVTEEDQPVLFDFIHKLCDELGAPEPNRVFVSPDVNAAVMPRTSLVNLFVQPKKDLLIGLGLVNSCNLSEFKSVMAHEFGHFGQSATAGSYTYVAYRIIIDLVEGEDWFDRAVNWAKRQDGAISLVGLGIGGMLWVGRKGLEWAFRAITLQRLVVSREQEFHADLVAVAAAGSEAVPLSLMRLRFGQVCLTQALNDLSVAMDHRLHTRDLFYHQEKAEPIVRRLRKAPTLGVRPDKAGPEVRIFDPDEEEVEHDEIPEMRRTHPPAHETEANAKEQYVPGVVDGRPPWVLFTDAAELRERVTYKLYRQVFKMKRDADLAEPEKVQEYIDAEHADTTYDPKYQGVYDDRVIESGDLDELDEQVRTSAWGPDRIDKVSDTLFAGAKGRAEEYAELQKDRAALENTPGRKTPRLKRKLKKLAEESDKAWEWFQALDRRSYLVHVQAAAAVNPAWRTELADRYRFQQEVQRMFREARFHQEKSHAFASHLFNIPPDQVHPDLLAEVMQVLREARRALKKVLQDAREVNLPAMRNFEEGERLADFILEEKLVPELPETYVKGTWVGKLLTQLDTVKQRCRRLHFKSLGGILELQERIAAAWRESRAPVEAEVVEAAEFPNAPVAARAPLSGEHRPPPAPPEKDGGREHLPRSTGGTPVPQETGGLRPPLARPAAPAPSRPAVVVAPVVVRPPEPEPAPVFVLPPDDPPAEVVFVPPGDEPGSVFVLPSIEPDLNLDLGRPPADPEPAPPAEPVGLVLSLDPEPAPQPPAEAPPPLDAGEPAAVPAPARSSLHEAMTVVEARGEVLDDSVELAAPPRTLTKPARGKRPALAITFLRPGQASPLGP
ncbi:MAG: M48 family metalloprotease [Gemmataceae bacterium]|nr:M48 family metalloprotease [Gemmataceae bacterium]